MPSSASSVNIPFSVPAEATEYWIEAAWATNGTSVYSLPYVNPTQGTGSVGILIREKNVVVSTGVAWGGYTAHVIIAYK